MLRMTHTHSKTVDITTSAGKLPLTAAGNGAISVKRMSEGLMESAARGVATNTAVIPANAGNQYSSGLCA
jgi:hypothetical protein